MVKLIIQWSVILRSCGEGGLTYEVKYVWFYPKKITIKIAALRYCNLNLKILSKVFCTIPTLVFVPYRLISRTSYPPL